MLSPERPDRIHVAFDDHRLVANAGLTLPTALTLHLGLPHLLTGTLTEAKVGFTFAGWRESAWAVSVSSTAQA